MTSPKSSWSLCGPVTRCDICERLAAARPPDVVNAPVHAGAGGGGGGVTGPGVGLGSVGRRRVGRRLDGNTVPV